MQADTRVFERSERREVLRKEPGLHLFRNLEFLDNPSLGFQLLGRRPALRLDRPADFVKAHQPEGIAVRILEAGEDSSPNRRRLLRCCCALCRGFCRLGSPHPHLVLETLQTRRIPKAYSTSAPFVELGSNVFRHKSNLRGPSNELVFLGLRLGRHQRQVRRAVGRSNCYPATPGLNPGVKGQTESKLFQVKS